MIPLKQNVWEILAEHYLDFHSLCALLTVSKDCSRLVDLQSHNWNDDPMLNNNVVGRLERAYTESMVLLRKFSMENRTITKPELWPYFGVQMENGNQWTIIAPSVPLCESTNYFDLRESESFGESVDPFQSWPKEPGLNGCCRKFARIKTAHWSTKTPLLRFLFMQKLRHSACRHTEGLLKFCDRFARGQKTDSVVEKQYKSKLLRRTAEPIKKSSSKRKRSETVDCCREETTQESKSVDYFRPKLVNFDPKTDLDRLVCTKH